MEDKQLLNTECTVEIIDSALPNDYGVGKIDNFSIFVPDVIVGDIVRVKVVRVEKRYAYGKVIRIETPSPSRITPECPHFKSCGGCMMQDLDYQKQLSIKENYLLQTLRRIGKVDTKKVEVAPIIPSPKKYFYRNKIELSFGEKKGKIALGLRERASPFRQYTGRITPIDRCMIFNPVLEKIIPAFLDFLSTLNLAPYNLATHKGFLRHLIIRIAESTGETMFILETTGGATPDLNGLWNLLVTEIPEVKSFFRIINYRDTDVIYYEKKIHLFGNQYIEDRLGGFIFHIYPESFYQPNILAAENLYNTIVNFAKSNNLTNVVGLYCGIGPIEISLSRVAKEVIGIDSNPTNVINALENCKLNGITNCLFYEDKVENILRTINIGSPDLLIIDPPRGGMSKEGLNLLQKIDCNYIAYVSCNPSTFARDLKDLQKYGYNIKQIIPFDFFPHTAHIESLAFLSKKGAEKADG